MYRRRDIVPRHFLCRCNRCSNQDMFVASSAISGYNARVLNQRLSISHSALQQPEPLQRRGMVDAAGILKCTLTQPNRFVTPSQHTVPTCIVLMRHTIRYEYIQTQKLCMCSADVLPFVQKCRSNGRTVRVRIRNSRQARALVVCWSQLLPYEAETQTAQRCQAARWPDVVQASDTKASVVFF